MPPHSCFSLVAALLALSVACGSPSPPGAPVSSPGATLLTPVSYTSTPGDGRAEAGPRAGDYYDEPGNQLIDGVIGADNYRTAITRNEAYEWVGWWTRHPEIIFHFDRNVSIGRVLVGFNNFGQGRVHLPVRVVVAGKEFVLRGDEVPRGRRGFVPFEGPFSGPDLTLRIEFPTQQQWVFVDEVKFESAQ